MKLYKKGLERVVLVVRDLKLLQLLFESKVVSRDQINTYIFGSVHKNTLNRRLKKLMDLGLLRRVSIESSQKVLYGYTITSKGFHKIRPTLPYPTNWRSSRSECPGHDITLVDIRRAFESKGTVENFYSENVLQSYSQNTENNHLQPFIELNCDGMVSVNTKVGVLNLAVEYEANKKSKDRSLRKVSDYYENRDIEGVIYICADQSVLRSLQATDREVSKRHQCDPKIYFALLDDVLNGKDEIIFRNVEKYIFRVR